MSNRLDEIKQRVELRTTGDFNRLHLASDGELVAMRVDDVRWIVGKVERMREMLRPLEFGSMGACRFCTGYHTHDADCEWVKAMGEK